MKEYKGVLHNQYLQREEDKKRIENLNKEIQLLDIKMREKMVNFGMDYLKNGSFNRELETEIDNMQEMRNGLKRNLDKLKKMY